MSAFDSLEGRILIAMPQMADPRFARSVIYICAHNEDGAMGLVVNKAADSIEFGQLLKQLNIPLGDQIKIEDFDSPRFKVHFGGPVEPGRGFVLHSPDYGLEDNTLRINEDVGLTATLDILKEIAAGRGPRQYLLALGYAGWSPGQLEQELLHNGWLHCDADDELLFDTDLGGKYDTALQKIGVDPAGLSTIAGHA